MAEIQLVDIGTIKVGKRIRKDLGDLTTLEASLRKHGMLNPIVVGPEYALIAGERRLQSARNLGWSRVPCRILSPGDETMRLEIEIDENATRKEFSSDEMADALHRLERLQNPSWFRRLRRWLRSLFNRLFRRRRGAGGPPSSD